MRLVESFLTKNPCYTAGRKITVKGLMLHSVGCPQPRAQVFLDSWNHTSFGSACVHGFIDGNKRIAITAASMFLLMNGYMYIVKDFLFRMETISYHVAAGNIDKDLLLEIITSILYEEDYSEELKLKLMNAYSKNEVDIDD